MMMGIVDLAESISKILLALISIMKLIRYKFSLAGISILFIATTIHGQNQKYPTESIEPFYGLNFSTTERDSLQTDLDEYQAAYKEIHQYKLDNSTGMSLLFNPYPTGFERETIQRPIDWGLPKEVKMPANKEHPAFYTVYQLSVLLKSKKITSTQLTKLYLSRLKKYGDTLQCVITILEETALQQARKADEEIASGKYKGPLHGIPYGIKDLLSVKGTKTTWGATPFKDQSIEETAAVVKKLEEAGAVLIAKLTMGALAMGDIWYGGVTKNPWNLTQGSSGSSAGSASATAAGLVAFAIGTETWGSIVSPSTRCGITGLRPTYGMVSRHGAMALSWSMDKIGPMARSVLDCAIIYNVIKGGDGLDQSVTDAAFNYDAKLDIKKLRIGYFKELFDSDTTHKVNNQKVIDVITGMGVALEPVKLPNSIPVNALSIILSAEAAAAFDNLTRSNLDSLLVNQKKGAWPNIFRGARFIPAAEYVNATRIRQQLIESYYQHTKDYDVIISPSFEGDQLLMTNLTGHPCLVVPSGFNEKGSPTSISFVGKLQGEAALITVGRAYQEATKWDEEHPPMFVP